MPGTRGVQHLERDVGSEETTGNTLEVRQELSRADSDLEDGLAPGQPRETDDVELVEAALCPSRKALRGASELALNGRAGVLRNRRKPPFETRGQRRSGV